MKLESLTSLRADVVVFDNDGTLYKNQGKIETYVVSQMIDFIASFLALDLHHAAVKRLELLRKHSTKSTLIALHREGVNESDFIKKTYLAFDPRGFGLEPSLKLRHLLAGLEGEKVVLTNNPSEFARKILGALGVVDLFAEIIGMQEMGYNQKPDPNSFSALRRYLSQGKKVVFVDDELPNVLAAKKLGCVTVFVDEEGFGAPDFWMPHLTSDRR